MLEELIKYGLPVKRAKVFVSNLETKSNGCIEWNGPRHKQGYGQFKLIGKSKLTHRIVAKAFHGESKKPCVCHTCDNPPCVNPDHLFWGTHSENVQDMYDKGRASNNKGTKNHFNKLSEANVNMVRFLVRSKVKVKAVAEMFDVTPSLIYMIKNRKIWNELKYTRPFNRKNNIRIRKAIYLTLR